MKQTSQLLLKVNKSADASGFCLIRKEENSCYHLRFEVETKRAPILTSALRRRRGR